MNRDRLTRARRSWNMSRIRGKDTTPEKAVRTLLHRMGYRFRLNVKIPIQLRTQEKRKGKPPFVTKYVRPDIVLPKYKTAIFVHGCFWHRHRGCKNCTTPTHRRDWWLKKLEGNATRDQLYQRELRKLGWKVVVIWECQAASRIPIQKLETRIKAALNKALQTLRLSTVHHRAPQREMN